MKVLFAVSNENISTQIVKKYQKDYKEIISYKNMYYFNAIVKELQRDKSYDRIVISEDLEPFANNNSDAIDKFLFEKLDNISDEATGKNGEDIPIILLSTDRRTKSEPILVKLFGIGIYNALLGQDRSTTNVCSLLNKPRGKKEAKIYYQIEAEEVSYKSESEDSVSEAEIQNIRNHYSRIGKDEERIIESFNNIAAQYNEAQLRVITKFLPLNVKAILEERSPKYQSVMTFGAAPSAAKVATQEKEEGLKIGFLDNGTSTRPSRPVIVPTEVRKVAMKKSVGTNTVKKKVQEEKVEDILPGFEDIEEVVKENTEVVRRGRPKKIVEASEEKTEVVSEVKRGRGRPKKIVEASEEEKTEVNVVKRGRGRPKKVVEEVKIEETTLPGFDEDDFEDDNILPGFNNINENNNSDTLDFEEETTLPGFDSIEDDEEDDMLPGFENKDDEDDDVLLGFDMPKSNLETNINRPNINSGGYGNSYYNNTPITPKSSNMNYSSNINIPGLLSKDKKVVAFVGTTKNGTSFLVNNLAKCLSTMGISTAILDLTTNRNSYYIYTKNEEQLRNVAFESIKKLRSGITSGIQVDRSLDVYTALPGDKLPLEDVNGIMSTLVQKYSVVLIDCDFDTPVDYFAVAQEIYIVQTMDILTIQPMTAFLRDLKAKDILKQENLRIVINKETKVRGLTSKAIIGGLAFYNDPAMAFMTELFNKDTVKYCTIPFEEETYARYLEGVMDCEITINGYSKNFNMKLKELANMVYPLIGNKYKPMGDYSSNYKFSADMNSTLEQMKNKY